MELRAMLFAKGRSLVEVRLGHRPRDIKPLLACTRRALELAHQREHLDLDMVLDEQQVAGEIEYDAGHGVVSLFRFRKVAYASVEAGCRLTLTGENEYHLVAGPIPVTDLTTLASCFATRAESVAHDSHAPLEML